MNTIVLTEEMKRKLKNMYNNRNLKIPEIANLSGVGLSTLTLFYHECFEAGELKPRKAQIALKPRPKVKKESVSSGLPRGQRKSKKFTDEQDQQIAIDYYENDLTIKELQEKWGIWPKQVQRIRREYGWKYPKKTTVPKKWRNK